jgi:Fe2+ or Zn2+ uptake regulation protein
MTGQSPADRAEQATSHLLSGRVRSTAARQLVIRALSDSDGPITAAELHRALGSAVPLSSLYRNLAVLGQAGVLAREHDAAGVARYELAEWLTGHHHHLICAECGEVRDVAIPPDTERTITDLVERVADRAGYRISGHRIDIEGMCPACRGS